VPHPLDRLVIEVNPSTTTPMAGRLHPPQTVVLGGDFNPPRFQVFDRLVAAPMSELELEGPAAKGLAKDLVSQANPKIGRPV
jgi:hypothetical protein